MSSFPAHLRLHEAKVVQYAARDKTATVDIVVSGDYGEPFVFLRIFEVSVLQGMLDLIFERCSFQRSDESTLIWFFGGEGELKVVGRRAELYEVRR